MKKLKNFWHNNSVLLVLFMILIACLVAISVVVVTYFVGDSKSNYGDRLENISEHVFSEKEQEAIVTKIKEDELVEEASVRTSGKIVYVTINFQAKVTLVEAQSKSLASLEYFSEDVVNFYDIIYMIKADSTEKTDGFQIMGAHNVNGTGGIVWNNNTQIVLDEKE